MMVIKVIWFMEFFNEFSQNIGIFSVDNSLAKHSENCWNNNLILGVGYAISVVELVVVLIIYIFRSVFQIK